MACRSTCASQLIYVRNVRQVLACIVSNSWVLARWPLTLFFAVGDGGDLEVVFEVVGDGFADHGAGDHLVGDEADGILPAVDDNEKVAVGAQKSGERHFEGVILANIVNIFVEVFEGAVGFFDLQTIELFGVQKSGDAAGGADDRKMLEAGLIEGVERERTEEIVFVHEGHLGFWQHDRADWFFREAHGGGDDVALLTAEDVFVRARQHVDQFFFGLRGVGVFFRAILFESGIKRFDYFCHQFEK